MTRYFDAMKAELLGYYPELDPGVELTKVPSLDLYREPDPFRVPKPREFRDLVDVEEFLTMCTGGFPEPKTFSSRVAKLLRYAGDRIMLNVDIFNALNANPVLTENLTGLARMVRSYALPAMENVALWHERDISHSSVERMIGPDATVTLDFALNRLAGIIDKLVVYPANM